MYISQPLVYVTYPCMLYLDSILFRLGEISVSNDEAHRVLFKSICEVCAEGRGEVFGLLVL